MANRFTRREVLAGAAAGGTAASLAATGAAFGTAAGAAQLSGAETSAVDEALGKKGTMVQDQGVYTVALPRNDLKVSIKGEPVPIPFGFGGWVSFKKTRDGRSTTMMSDTVLLQDEVNGVISAALANGVEVSAIHNHFFWEEPRIFYMHLHAMGEPARLARSFSDAICGTKLHPANQPPPGPPPARTGKEIFDLPQLDRSVGHQGVVNGPTYKYTVGRSDLTVTAMETVLTAAMGLNSWASFAGSMNRARIAGDIAMLEPEVNPVVSTLRKNGLDVVALHHHMLGEQPRIIFLHYYGTGEALRLARGFRAALNELGKHGRGMRMGTSGHR